MRIKGISSSALEFIVYTVSHLRYNGNIKFKREPERKGNFLHFTLTVHNSSGKGARRSNTGRRIAALCWHGHRDVMRTIFDNYPDALLITALARYDGAESFADQFEATGNGNIGSIARPCKLRDACECNEIDLLSDSLRDIAGGISGEPWITSK
jgi:hypothetical protein